jgi:drug/metabolite transporter (DMT)-like permease
MTLAIALSFGVGVAVQRRRVRFLPIHILKKHGWAFGVEVFFGSLFFLYGLSHAPLVLGTVLTSLAPVIAVPIALMMRLENFNPKRVLGVVITLLGLSLIGLN